MLIQVNPHKIVLIKTNDVNSGEYNVNECTFEFSQEFDNLTCIAVFSLCDGTTRNITILNNRCIIPTEVLQQTGQVKIGVYGYSVQDDELVLRYSPTPQIFVVTEGSYKEGTEPVAPTPTDWEILVQQVSDNSRDIADIQEDIGDINTEIGNINNAINDLDDKKANINDLSAVAFSGSYNDLIDKPNLSVYATKTDLSDEATLRENADVALQEQIDAISVSSDVVDVVGTYQELLNYDTQHLKDNDIVKVLDDSTHNDALSYYRWDKEPQTWSYIGSEGPFYTKAETQELLNAKEDKITTTNKLDADLVDDSNSTNKFVTEEDITYWDNKEDKSNKVTEINSSSTDTQYPSAKCVYDSQVAQDTEIDTLKMIYNILPTDTDTGETISIDNTGEMPIKNISLGGNTSQVVIPAESGTNVNATSISISDVDTSKEHYFELDGNTYQETTTGKNLCPNNLEDGTINGVTFVVNDDGSIKVTGTASARTEPYLYRNTVNPLLFKAGSYKNTSNYPIIMYADGYILMDKNSIVTLTEDKLVAYIYFRIEYTGTSLNETYYPQIISSSITDETYEPYTNGPSPNPDYPQNIEVVTGENTIVISNGDNSQSQSYQINLGNIELCKISTYKDRIYQLNNKWYLEKQIGKVVLDGTESWRDYTNRYGLIYFYTGIDRLQVPEVICDKLKNIDDIWNLTTYQNIINGSTTNRAVNIMLKDEEINTVNKLLAWLPNNNLLVYYPLATPTTTEITDSTLVSQLNALANSTLYATTNINTTTSNLLPYIDLQYNVVTPSPSPSRPSVVNVVKGENTLTICGKNLFSGDYSQFTNTGGEYDLYDYFKIHDNDDYYTLTMIAKNDFVTNGTTYFGFTGVGGGAVGGVDFLVSGNMGTISKGTILTKTSNRKYLSMYSKGANNFKKFTDNFDIQLEKNSTATTYEPYKLQTYPINLPSGIELCKISTYQDYFYKDNGNWYKHSEIGKVVLNGSENWDIASDIIFYTTDITDYATSENIPFANYFVGITNKGTASIFKNSGDLKIAFNTNTAIPRLFIRYDALTTTSELETWLSTHNTIVYYALGTPTNTQITDTTLITQLDNLQKAISYDSQTNISQTNDDKPFIITAEMFLSLKNVLN